MPTALLTNLNINSRTGSELHTLEFAKQLQNRGYVVTCFCLCAAYPLLKEFEEEGIKVLTLGDETKLENQYDLFIAQHRVVSEYIYSLQRITFSSIFVSVLGLSDEHEGLPFFTNLSDGIIAVSHEVKGHIENSAQAHNIQLPPVHVFPNYCTKSFYDYNYQRNNELRSICCISNHPAPECLEAFELLKKDGIRADVFGYQSQSVKVTPELLSQYDAVVSIGRTAQECMSMGIPFYCYDHFGGPGYITPNNIEHNALFNFSGRPEKRKSSAQQLYSDLVNSYAAAQRMQSQIKDLCINRFQLENLFEQVMSFINANKNKKPCAQNPISDEAKELYRLKAMNYSTSYENACIGHGELFYDKESEFNPQARQCNSYQFKYRYSTEVEIELPEQIGSGLIIIRFDPDDKPCKCSLSNYKPTSNNCFSSNAAQETFLTFDPQYQLSGAKRIHFIANKLDLSDVICICNQINKKQTSIFGKLFHK